MKKSSYPTQKPSHSAFTLLELLVVIAIIGLLAGMLSTAATGVMRRAEKTGAQNTALNLKTAISTYFTEYRKYPVDPNTDESQEIFSDEEIMDVLLGADNEQGTKLNPRKIVFFTGSSAKKGGQGPGDDSEYRKGVRLNSDGGGFLVDPYNNYYRIALDLDYNNRIQKPSWDTSTDVEMLPQTILIWSKGRDDNENNIKDNIKTW